MKLIYFFYLFPPLFPFPCDPFLGALFLHFSTPPCYFGRLLFLFCFLNKEKATGYVTRGLEDGPSRHPEKVYPGGEGHERGGRGEGRGQLRQRLYGGSDIYPASFASHLSLPLRNVHLSLRTDPPYSHPPPSLPVSCFPVSPRR